LNAIKQAEGFDHLTEAVQRLVIKLDSGETNLQAVIAEQYNETRELVVAEFGKLRLEMRSDVDHKMVLQSLHFPEMMSRQENVRDAYSNTSNGSLTLLASHISTKKTRGPMIAQSPATTQIPQMTQTLAKVHSPMMTLPLIQTSFSGSRHKSVFTGYVERLVPGSQH
jgi:hypothetical protein